MTHEPNQSRRWSRRKIAVVLYPFVAAAVAINLFLLGLVAVAIGLPGLTPVLSLLLAVPLGVPATIGVSRWVDRLIDEANR